MMTRVASLYRRPTVKLAAFVLTTIALVSVASALVPAEKVCPDFIQFWTAANLLSSGQDPYDAALQARVQRGLGWDRATDGLGLYDFLPYYYPPWLGLAFVPLLPLGYPLAKITWLVLNAELLLIAAFLLRDTVEGIPRLVPLVAILAFSFSFHAMTLGQVSPLVLFLIAVAWKLLDGRRDGAGGCVLALATIKPQLTGILVVGILLWSARRRRWGVVRGFAAALAALGLACAFLTPAWPIAMARATWVTPPPTFYFPWSGATWLIVLKALGVRGWLLAGGYLLVAIPLVVAIIRIAIDPGRRLDDLICVSLIAAFFLAPYGRPYDFPVLLIPALILVGTRLPQLPGTALLMALIVLPYAHSLAMASQKAPREVARRNDPEPTTFWIPLLIATAWCCSRPGGRAVEGKAIETAGNAG